MPALGRQKQPYHRGFLVQQIDPLAEPCSKGQPWIDDELRR